ncbi:MAG TPA: dihydropteroate synthase [Spirochaetota bacterium]|jgi:dihydropteroate synthase|nr:MAG: Dihydropteroate synthase [Spirochaetes bacterium ADurb.Bin133]HNZ27055.1 dihydropteroate synthase [Spirochaetota bacterium]HPY88162.1 dihydropteroate synthase [Spirochaetota bacterium]
MIYNFKNGGLDFSNSNVYLMGILNVTPDSFSDGGSFVDIDKALFHVEEMIRDGASIIDVGGESTRPFISPTSQNEELDRVIPVIEKINKNFQTIISIDTYKSAVAREAVKNGAEIINDITGFVDDDMIKVASEYKTACIVMHMKGDPSNMQEAPVYDDILGEISSFLNSQVAKLKYNGIHNIIIDVGFGFGKSLEDNYFLLKNLTFFKRMNLPILTGVSRKSMIGKLLDVPPKERDVSTVVLNAIAALNGSSILRIHNVKENNNLLKILKKYLEIS